MTMAAGRPDRAESHVQKVIKDRLKELGRNAFEAARIGELPRTFFHELVTGKKQSFRIISNNKVAKGLTWTVDQLTKALTPVGIEESGEAVMMSPTASATQANLTAMEGVFAGMVRIRLPTLTEEIPTLVAILRDAQMLAHQFAPK
jgi:hypothetical protein